MGVKITQKPKTLEQLKAKVWKIPHYVTLEVGYFPESKYMTGEYVAQVAYDNEYGTDKIPQRPFFQRAKNRMMKEYPNLIKKDLLKEKYISLKTIELIGIEYVNHIQRSISGEFGSFEPNSPLTIEKKGSDKPLIDTGVMLQQVTFKIRYNGT